MFTGPGAFWRHPRQPLAGVAAAAVGGILLAEAGRRWSGGLAGDPWPLAAVFLALAAAFCARPRPGVFWPLVIVGYAALHGFYTAPVPATRLAARLAATSDPAQRSVIQAEGTILDVPRDASPPGAAEGPLWRFTLALDAAELDGVRWPSRAPVSVAWRGGPPALAAGDRLALTGTAANLAPPRNPGEFDLAGWRRRHGIFSEVRVQGVADGIVLPSAGSSFDRARARLAALAAHCREAVAACLARDLDDAPDVRAVTATMLLGLHGDPGLGDELESLFQRTGTLHYFAVDGLKLGLLAALCLRVLEFTGRSRAAVNRWVLPLLGGYALASGLGPASLRAVFVAAVVVGGAWLDRPARPGNGLGAAAALLLLWDTRSLFDLGFQLTFLVVLAILTLARPLGERLRRLGAPDPFLPRTLYSPARHAWEWLRRGTLDLTAVALAAWLGSLPVMLWAFGWVSPVSPLANVLSFPLAFAVLSLGVLSVAGGGLSTAWSVWMNNANWLAARGFLCVVRACDALPGGSLHVGDPTLWHWTAPAAEITLLDTSGQGYSAHLRAGNGADWLFDTGRAPGYGRVVRPYLRARAVERLGGGLVLTQGDAPHLAAAPLALADFAPVRLVEPPPPSARSPSLRTLRETLAARGGPPETFCRRGETVALGPGVWARVLSPAADPVKGQSSAVARALVLRIEAAGWRVLFLPDGGRGPAAGSLLASAAPDELRCDVLVSADPPTEGWLRAAGPAWVLRQDGGVRQNNRPDEAATTFTQSRSGAITLSVYPARLEARGFVDGRRLIKERHPR